MNLLLTINFVIILFKSLLITFNPIYSYLIWDMSLMFHITSLSYIVGKLLPKSNIIGRLLNFSLLIVSSCLFIEYIIKCLESYYEVFNPINYITFVIYSCIILPVIGHMFLPLSRSNDRYNRKGCFLVYKRGASKLGMLFGHCSLVCKGVRYYYKDGKLVKKEFKYRGDCIYERIRNVNTKKIDKLLGCRWSILNNCYNLKERLKND